MRVAVCYHEGRSTHPSFKSIDQRKQRDLYWECIVAALSTAKRYGGAEVAPTLFTNVAEPDERYRGPLREIGAELIEVDFTYAPPDAYQTLFRGAFYMLDAVRWAAETLGEDETILFIDPDCLVTGDLADVARHIRRYGMSAYRIWYPRDENANGISRAGLGRWLSAHDPEARGAADPVWLGGEYLGLTGAAARRLHALIAQVWGMNLGATGGPALRTEEHVLSAAAALGGLAYHDGGRQFVRRIWTRGRYRNFNARMEELCIWHLPGEKGAAIRNVFQIIADGDPGALDTFIAERKFLLNRYENLRYLAYSCLKRLGPTLAGRPTDFERDTH